MIGFAVMVIAGIAIVVAIPVAIVAAIRVLNLSVNQPPRPSRQVEARLQRMEEAIDAMALEIERLRSAEATRYVTGGRREAPPVPPDDPPTFR